MDTYNTDATANDQVSAVYITQCNNITVHYCVVCLGLAHGLGN